VGRLLVGFKHKVRSTYCNTPKVVVFPLTSLSEGWFVTVAVRYMPAREHGNIDLKLPLEDVKALKYISSMHDEMSYGVLRAVS
jgi:hypothetical protein